jgi:hypothetical protein
VSKNGNKGKNGYQAPPALLSPEGLQRIKEAFERRRPLTKEAARKLLVDSGIYTKTGRLTKHYR